MSLGNALTYNNTDNSPENKYLYNGKEKQSDFGLEWYDYGARFYDPALARFMTLDPLAEKFISQTGYAYASNTPIVAIDYNGLETRLITETTGLGHAFVVTGTENNLTVYTYGRYGALGKDKGSANFTNTTGEGVLIKWTGEKAMEYLNNELNNNDAQVFELLDVNEDDVVSFFEDALAGSDETPSKREDKQDENETAKVVDEYSLLTNNCTTKTMDGAEKGGFEGLKVGFDAEQTHPKFISTPQNLQTLLQDLVNQSGSGVTDVTEQFKKLTETE